MRQNGFYWVKEKGLDWTIAEWSFNCWLLTGCDVGFDDSIFESIDENKLVRE